LQLKIVIILIVYNLPFHPNFNFLNSNLKVFMQENAELLLNEAKEEDFLNKSIVDLKVILCELDAELKAFRAKICDGNNQRKELSSFACKQLTKWHYEFE